MQGYRLVDRSFERLKVLITELTGLRLSSYKDPYLRRRIAVRMRRAGVDTYDGYADLLRSDEAEQRFLVDTLGVNVTEFFRDPSVFQMIEDYILPRLLETRDPSRTLRAWSAGCASGEEAYTLALVFLRAFRAAGEERRFRIYATDMDGEALDLARRGHYGAAQVKNVPTGALEEYFRPEGDGFVVREPLQQPILFARLDLTSARYPRGFDLVLCRNVIIYFDRPTHEEVFRGLYASLNPWGFLILGRTEAIWGSCREMFIPLNPRERVYQKVEGWAPTEAAPEAARHTSQALPHRD